MIDKKSKPLPHIISDDPESTAPQFRFAEYAQSIADVIGNPENQTPLVLGLYGAWGSGKTTLMKRVEHYLQPAQKKPEYRTCKTVWFQAWKYADEDAILAALIEEIFKAIHRDTFEDSVKASIEAVIGKFQLTGALGDVVKGLTGGVIDPGKWFASLPYKDKLGFYDVFQECFDRLVWAYVTPTGLKVDEAFNDREGALVIFIDDLDRCPHPRVVKVLETIKLFMDKSGCVFVIGADREVIETAIKETYPDGAQQFMDKIVQVTFALPPVPTPDIQKFLIKHAPEQQAMMEKFAPLIARVLGHNIRAVKRFLNNMRLAESLVASVGGDLSRNPHALMRWSIVEYVYPDLAKVIRAMCKLFP
ncbi:MAG: P-loop NTPase fold protein [Nitrospirae bacterium]|nr:P-loop NTPase fold protein [Nitrospirota bacterium]MDA1304423.1 P-loop NTPase fold protein [Nitrospirota bacterium]